eukprot:GILJ01000010.1.p1 GENE.GILJ01000010.1~~GILJ01000010.1.p1  ORF type:complete len:234 (+),score=43.45 GILJ01000010.1:51-752(+)
MPPKPATQTKPKGAKKPHAPRNHQLIPGVGALSRSAVYSKTGRWALKNKTTTPKQTKAAAPVSAWYAAEDAPKPFANRRTAKPGKVRASITPGTVLILLAGPYRGKRVVCLKALPSGLLVITGPHKVNGVPLRRVNQAYVIATSTKVDVSKVDATKFTDEYFRKAEEAKPKKTEDQFFAQEEKKHVVSADRKADQAAVDAALMPALKSTPLLAKYLNSRFSLKQGQYPHQLVF